MTLIDLTHTLTEQMPTWTGGCGFHQQIKRDYPDGSGDVRFRVQQIKMHAGLGTHMDAPSHCIEGGDSIADIPLNALYCPCVVIHVPQVHERYCLRVCDIQAFEFIHGTIPKHVCVIISTGWAQYWSDPVRHRNHLVFPSVSAEAAEYLLERDICGLGIDTLSPDRPEDGFPVHHLILGAGKYIIENVAGAHKLPPIGAHTLALPIKTAGGTEAPIRLIGLMP